MALKLFEVEGGFSDGLVHYLSGAGLPGGDAAFQDAAPIGSYYSDTTTGITHKKKAALNATTDWEKQATVSDLAGLTANQSWREPVIVADTVNTTIANAVAEMNTADTLDGVTIASGDRVLLTNIVDATGVNVYIVGGSTGAWTLTEDTNQETAGDTLQVLAGTHGNEIWMYDGTGWMWIGATSSGEDGFIRAFIGKSAAGGVLPSYTSQNVIVNGDSLQAAVGKIDGAVGSNNYASSNYLSGSLSLTDALLALDAQVNSTTKTVTVPAVTTATVLDSVLVDNNDAIKWVVVAVDDASPNKKEAREVLALHDGTPAADAVEADETKYAKLKVNGGVSGMNVDVLLSGVGASQTMTLTVSASSATTFTVQRTALV